MIVFIAGLLVFLGVHSVAMVAPGWRAAQIERFGEMRWKGLYALVSAAGFVALLYGYGMARQAPTMLYTPPPALHALVLLLMLPVFPLLIAAYVPSRIKMLIRHPMLCAVLLWATAHLLANGTLNDVLLFGGFLIWAGLDLLSLVRRDAARPVSAAAAPPLFNDWIVVTAGLLLYALVIVWAHAWLVGVAPLA